MSTPGETRDAYDGFRNELMKRETELGSLLPSTLSREAFLNTAIIACKRNPELLLCDRRGLHNAVSAAAFDGLLPDGREGVILPQWEKVKDKDTGREHSILTARWQPMVHGIRKRARELGDTLIDAHVVHVNDEFDYELGDNPFIRHKPNHLTDRGQMACAYAIFKKQIEGTDRFIILHREVMLMADIMAVKSISKQPNGVMWKQFEGEAWRKSAIRRGIKSVPSVDSRLRTIVERFDELHTVDPDAAPSIAPEAAPPKQVENGSAPQSDARQAARDRMRGTLTTIKGGAALPPPQPMSPDEKMLADLRSEISTGELVEIIEQRFASRIIGASTDARERAIAVIQEAKAEDKAATG